MSADNTIIVVDFKDCYGYGHILGECNFLKVYESLSFNNTYKRKENVLEKAFELLKEIGYVEYGVQTINFYSDYSYNDFLKNVLEYIKVYKQEIVDEESRDDEDKLYFSNYLTEIEIEITNKINE